MGESYKKKAGSHGGDSEQTDWVGKGGFENQAKVLVFQVGFQ